MANGKDVTRTRIGVSEGAGDVTSPKQAEEALLKAGALQSAIFNSANFSSIATDAKGVIQIFNVGAERMLGYAAAEVMNKITPADISDPEEVIARAEAMGVEVILPRHRNPPDGDGGPNHWEIWLRDPDGYKVVLASPDGTADGGWRP